MFQTNEPIFLVHDLIEPTTIQQEEPQPNQTLSTRTLKQRGIHEFRVNGNGIEAFEYFKRSVETDHDPESVLYIAQMYSQGLHGSINSDKITAGRMYQVIIANAIKFPHHIVITARQQLQDLTHYNPNDIQPNIPSLPDEYPFELTRLLVHFRDYPQTQQELRRQREHEEERRRFHFMENPLRQHVAVQFAPQVMNFNAEDPLYIEDVIRNLQGEDQIQQIARVQVVNNDAQNVHSPVVLTSAQNVLNSIESNKNKSLTLDDCKILIIDACTKNGSDINKVQRVINSFTLQKHTKFDKSDTQIFITMVQKIQSEQDTTKRNNLMEILCKQLESCIEKNQVVCNTGRIVRILSVYDGVDDSVQKIMPEFVVDQELANLATRIRETILQNATEEQRNAYDTGDPDVSDDLTKSMVDVYTKEVHKIYDSLVPKHLLDRKIDIYIQGF
jgi:hypothetical protein